MHKSLMPIALLSALTISGCASTSETLIAPVAVPVDVGSVKCPRVSTAVRNAFNGGRPARPIPDTTTANGAPAVSTRALLKGIDDRDAMIVSLKAKGRQIVNEHDRCRRRAANPPRRPPSS